MPFLYITYATQEMDFLSSELKEATNMPMKECPAAIQVQKGTFELLNENKCV
jgi:hypothetical protein